MKYFDMESFLRILNKEDINYKTFENIKAFVNAYDNRKHLEKELTLFSIVGCYYDPFRVSAIESNKKERDMICSDRLVKLNEFLSSLTEEELNENVYFQLAKIVMEYSAEESEVFAEEVINKLYYNKQEKVEIKIGVNEDSKILFMPKMNYLNIFRRKYPHVCDRYMKFTFSIIKLIDDIYFLQLWKGFNKIELDGVEIVKFSRFCSEKENYIIVGVEKIKKEKSLERKKR